MVQDQEKGRYECVNVWVSDADGAGEAQAQANTSTIDESEWTDSLPAGSMNAAGIRSRTGSSFSLTDYRVTAFTSFTHM